jgi:hypothetical protein
MKIKLEFIINGKTYLKGKFVSKMFLITFFMITQFTILRF